MDTTIYYYQSGYSSKFTFPKTDVIAWLKWLGQKIIGYFYSIWLKCTILVKKDYSQNNY